MLLNESTGETDTADFGYERKRFYKNLRFRRAIQAPLKRRLSDLLTCNKRKKTKRAMRKLEL